jgi:hypothetical protein
MEEKNKMAEAVGLIFEGIDRLRGAFPNKEFTIDGRLVGDIGEIVAALEYDIELFDALQEGHHGKTTDGRLVQVRATFKDSLTFPSVPHYYLGLKLRRDGTHEEVYNGPGKLVYEKYKHRSGIGKKLLSFPNNDLRELSAKVSGNDRIPKRKG